MVWALDSKGNLFVREGIFSHYQIGTSWVYVGGIEAIHVSISGTSVWALGTDGRIYRRCGISDKNYIGDFWKSIPGDFKMTMSLTGLVRLETPEKCLEKIKNVMINEKTIYQVIDCKTTPSLTSKLIADMTPRRMLKNDLMLTDSEEEEEEENNCSNGKKKNHDEKNVKENVKENLRSDVIITNDYDDVDDDDDDEDPFMNDSSNSGSYSDSGASAFIDLL